MPAVGILIFFAVLETSLCVSVNFGTLVLTSTRLVNKRSLIVKATHELHNLLRAHTFIVADC